MSARVWVTGASGMLGRVLADHLEAKNWKPVRLSRTGRDGTAPLELSDAAAVSARFEKDKPQIVIHSAAYSEVDGCERDPEFARAANATSTKNLAALCARAGAPLVYISTDYVFSGAQKTPYRETDATFPVNVYGLTKLEGEYHALACASGGAVVRVSWLFGGANPLNFVNAILARLKKEKEVAVLDDQTDSPTSVKDLSAALEKISSRLLSSAARGPASVYHFCNAGETTRLGMTERMREWLKLPVVVKVADRSAIRNRIAVRPPHCVMSCSRYENEFGAKIRPWQDALREYVTCAS